MLTLRAAATLLAQADSLAALRPLAHIMGFTTLQQLHADTQRDLNIAPFITSAELARGPGRLRCLSAQLAPPHPDSPHTTTDPREQTRTLCLTLAKAAPLRDWCVITLDVSTHLLCIAVVTPDPAGPRIAALRVDRRRVVDSDGDTLRSLAAITEPEPSLRLPRIADILGRNALSTRFYRALNGVVGRLADSASGPAAPAEKRELALLYTSRCLFLAFLEAKGWLNNDRHFLIHHTVNCLEQGQLLHDHLLRPLFFGTLNTPRSNRAATARAFGQLPFLNGGLFAPTPLEQRHRTLRFTNDALTELLGDLFDRYRFTAHEDSTQWSEAAIDPEMLGRAFESLMVPEERHQSGTYYTPPTLVSGIVQDALRIALPSLPENVFASHAPIVLTPHDADKLTNLHVLDPACGSGAFLVHALEQLATLRSRTGDTRPMHEIRRTVLTRNIFGVDRNPVAVWLCELRLWLSMVIECPETRIDHIPPLPNLDHHIRVGDSLAGGTFRFAPASARRLSSLRDRYTRATGVRKRTLASALDREERHRAIAECHRIADARTHERRELLNRLRARDLFGQRRSPAGNDTRLLDTLRRETREIHTRRRRLELGGALPFRFAAHFADVAAHGGFTMVIGNPPWIRPHALPMAERQRLRTEFRSIRNAPWKLGATRAGAGAGFAAQADVAVAFVERSGQLLAPAGVMALLVPAKLWRTLSGGGIRHWLLDHTHIRIVRDWSHAPNLFDAAVYPSLIVAERKPNYGAPPTPNKRAPSIRVAVSNHTGIRTFPVRPSALSLAADPAAPWLLLPANVRSAFERLRTAGPALGDSPLGRPSLGVKCGCNAAFLVHAVEHDDETATIHANGRTGTIERRMLRPALRGEAVSTQDAHKRKAQSNDLRIIWTHKTDGTPLRTLPPATARWLAQWRPRLEARRDARARQPWWTLFRTDAANHHSPRLVWADIARSLQPRVLEAGDPTVPLNSCYILRTAHIDDAWALSTILTSPLAAAWFAALAEPARGGFHRYMGWTVATLPVPTNWNRARTPLAEWARQHHRTSRATLLDHHEIVCNAYELPPTTLLPLVKWFAP